MKRAPAETPRRSRRWLVGGIACVMATLVGVFLLARSDWMAGGAEREVQTELVRPVGDAQSVDEALLDRPKVEVLNAAGISGIARRATEYLRERGFDVVYVGNADTFDLDSTEVIARTENIQPARAIARALGTTRVRVEPRPELYVDATVRLGKDWP